jgi:hypothetical protein
VASHDKSRPGKPINELNSAMVLQQHLLSKLADHDRASRVRLNDEQSLILPGGDTSLMGHCIAEGKKLPQGEPEGGESPIP